ncbi:hypothetical protein [Afifella sp. IM 167]|uniref:hypothetical protein n=1 Tax=Afifella sp. IM 167 TaxID=2033586 RepID=UPI001CCEF9AD|nr:hypothetical protein [Afifella sp. IM 167]MBZ8134130.1 hypothetical protein [Afifella sp. IM 167]
MIILSILVALVAISALCWLLFALATYALPAFAAIAAGTWAYESGAGLPGGLVAGLACAGLVFGIGQFLIMNVRPIWIKMAVALAFVAPAAIAGYFATHGIVKHLMPADAWQVGLSVLGAIAVGITAFVRITSVAAPERVGQGAISA